MQFSPDASVLLAAVGRLLDEQVLGAVTPDLQHQVRVAAHLVHLVEREQRLGSDNAAGERRLLAPLLDVDHGDVDTVDDLAVLVAALAERLRAGGDPDLERRAWPALVEITRADLAIAKPGHDAWEGE